MNKTKNNEISGQVELVELEKLVPYEGNAKKHPVDQIAALAASIAKFGWTQPIIVDKDYVIIIGHGRRLAAKKLGIKIVPVVVRRDLSKGEADALRLADNRVTSNDYDMTLLQSELNRLLQDGEDSIKDFFSEKELTTLSDFEVSEIDLDSFVEDIGEAVETQRTENKNSERDTDEEAAPLVDAMGFKRITVEQSRVIRNFIATLEEKYGLSAAESFVKHIKEYDFGNETE